VIDKLFRRCSDKHPTLTLCSALLLVWIVALGLDRLFKVMVMPV